MKAYGPERPAIRAQRKSILPIRSPGVPTHFSRSFLKLKTHWKNSWTETAALLQNRLNSISASMAFCLLHRKNQRCMAFHSPKNHETLVPSSFLSGLHRPGCPVAGRPARPESPAGSDKRLYAPSPAHPLPGNGKSRSDHRRLPESRP